MKTLFLGIDPGGSGGIALLGENFAQAWKMGDTEADTVDLLRTHAPSIRIGYIEALHPMPNSMAGNIGSFKLGKSYGFLLGALTAIGIPFEGISSQRWKKTMGLRFSKENTQTEKKNGSKELAQRLFPGLRITHATAEALLLAECCRRFHTGMVTQPQPQARQPERLFA